MDEPSRDSAEKAPGPPAAMKDGIPGGNGQVGRAPTMATFSTCANNSESESAQSDLYRGHASTAQASLGTADDLDTIASTEVSVANLHLGESNSTPAMTTVSAGDHAEMQSVRSGAILIPRQEHRTHHMIPLTELADRRRRLEDLAAAHPPHRRVSHCETGHHAPLPSEMRMESIGRPPVAATEEMEMTGDATFDDNQSESSASEMSIESELSHHDIPNLHPDENLENHAFNAGSGSHTGAGASASSWHSSHTATQASYHGEEYGSARFPLRRRTKFTPEQKASVIEAFVRGGRKEAVAAGAIQVPAMIPNTVDSLLARFKKKAEKGEDPYSILYDARKHNRGSSTKWDDKYHTEIILHLLHDKPTLSFTEMQNLLNVELARKKLKEYVAEHGNDVLQMTRQEQEEFYPLSNERLQALLNLAPLVKEWYKRARAGMKARLEFARKLKSLMIDPDQNMLIFIDEMPFYLAMRRTHGWSRKGDRAVVAIPPISNFGYRTQVAMAVHVTEEGSYKDFIKGKNVYLVINNAPEHTAGSSAPDADNRMLEKIENFAPLHDFLAEHGGSISILRTSPNSSHLNLCESYNRVLRTYSQHERNDADISSLLLAEEGPHGQETMRKLSALEIIIKKGIERLYNNTPLLGEAFKLFVSLGHVIEANGFF
ncbi:Hypothetical Protein FCC1311_049912 [Hondaea fermentalgiana]|uniref:Tc1-like transposase DDE domain-containing protein n=1 Tax=Hondaea fermentalgiana TaxID=2315210 RepID=A0A2R5GCS0_9STRA|nr:Hypothetical Protein FCC1311_049912 [Hondaea fermentalgiana]|eukprot:GBG28770.1 Hypothetical Protein FCC1311_049912 [Hondaea fermentalgiana]